MNEPDDKVKPEAHRHVVERVAAAIREHDRKRLIVCDGRAWGTKPPTELLGLDVAAALHDYNPMPLTHYKASWVNWNETWPKPEWPLTQKDGKIIDRKTIARDLVRPWLDFETKGVGVMVGEFGCHNRTPHRQVLAWTSDTLHEFKAANWGWRSGILPAASVSSTAVATTSPMRPGTVASSTAPCWNCFRPVEAA